MHKSSSKGLGILVGLLIVILLAMVGFFAFAIVIQSNLSLSMRSVEQPTEPKSFDEMNWQEVSAASQRIAQASTPEQARAAAQELGLAVGQTKRFELDNGRVVEARIIGMCQDIRSDNGAKAGLTIMVSPLSLEPMNQTATNAGGWEHSSLRSWLQTDGEKLLPQDLRSLIVPVNKNTNNIGVTNDPSSVTTTSDKLWLFSASEVCGSIHWFTDEYGVKPSVYTGSVDFVPYDKIIASEGAQYEWFAQAGVEQGAGVNKNLIQGIDGKTCNWWYRSAYPYSFAGDAGDSFYQVMSSGYYASVEEASAQAGVVVGLCL